MSAKSIFRVLSLLLGSVGFIGLVAGWVMNQRGFVGLTGIVLAAYAQAIVEVAIWCALIALIYQVREEEE